MVNDKIPIFLRRLPLGARDFPNHTKWILASLPLLIGLYSFAIRATGLEDNFEFDLDQHRDWEMVGVAFADLPLVGTSQSVGGYNWGPIYYWTLKLIRVFLGPFFDNLPHSGGIGLSAIQAFSVALITFGLLKRDFPIIGTLAIVILAASSPKEIGASRSIWNPPLAVSFLYAAIGTWLIWESKIKDWMVFSIVVMLAWFAVQAHEPAIFFAASFISTMILYSFDKDKIFAVFKKGVAAGLIILFLQIPFAADYLTHPDKHASSNHASKSLLMVVTDPAALAFYGSLTTMNTMVQEILLGGNCGSFWYMLLGTVFLLGCYVWYHGSQICRQMLLIAIGSVTLAWIGFSTTNVIYLHYYETLEIAAILFVAPLLLHWKNSAIAGGLSTVMLLVVILVQPTRIDQSRHAHSTPAYGRAVRAAKQIIADRVTIRAIEVEGAPFGDFGNAIYRYLGYGLDRDSVRVARVFKDGHLEYLRRQ